MGGGLGATSLGFYHMKKYVIIISSLILAFFLLYCVKAQNSKDKIYLMNKNYEVQMAIYDLYPTKSAKIVMFGNSLTFNLNWSEALNRKDIVNRGIIGDITQGYLKRIDYVLKLEPQVCFIEGGINDLYANFKVDDIYNNYIKIIELLKDNKTMPIVQSTIFVSSKRDDYQNKNIQVKELNNKLESYCTAKGIKFIDLNRLLSSAGKLKEEYTYDGVHLNADGYILWIKEVQNALELIYPV